MSSSRTGEGFRSVRLGKIALILVMTLLSLAAVYIATLIAERQKTLERLSRYHVAWSASQAVAEVGRLQHRVAAYGHRDTNVGADEVGLRFEIVLNRLNLLREGELDAFARSSPERLDIVEYLRQTIDKVQPLIDRLDEPGIVVRILHHLAPLDAKLAGFAGEANRYGSEQVAKDQHDLVRLHTLFSTMTGGLILAGIVLLVLVFVHNRLLRAAHDKMRALADNLSRTTVSKVYLDDIMNSMSEGLLVATRAGAIEKVNAAAAHLTRFSTEELLAVSVADLMPGTAASLKENGAIGAGDLRNIGEIATKGGALLPISLSCASMPDSERGEQRLVCVFQSLEQQRQAETEQARLREQLYQAQKMQAIGTLAGGIAHDFNNVLGSILGHGFLVLEDIDENHPARASLDQILAAGNRAKGLVQQILTYSRNAEFDLKPVSAAKAVAADLDAVATVLPAHVTVVRDRFDPVPINADLTQLHQVLLNLCVNAAQAIGDAHGEIRFRVERIELKPSELNHLSTESSPASGADGNNGAERSRMWFGVPADCSYCRITVSDTGCGMDRATMSRIFEPFFTTKEVGKGTGLGLAAVHGIIRNHNGVVAVESAVGFGTAFEIYFPVSEATLPDDVVAVPASAGEHAGSERIMVVDDDSALLDVTCKMLARFGYCTTAFSRPDEALARFRRTPHAWDIVVSDRSMPKMTGEEFAREVLKVRHDMLILMCTGYIEAVDEQRIRELGIAEVLYKPFNGDVLSAAVRRALEAPRALRAAA